MLPSQFERICYLERGSIRGSVLVSRIQDMAEKFFKKGSVLVKVGSGYIKSLLDRFEAQSVLM